MRKMNQLTTREGFGRMLDMKLTQKQINNRLGKEFCRLHEEGKQEEKKQSILVEHKAKLMARIYKIADEHPHLFTKWQLQWLRVEQGRMFDTLLSMDHQSAS
jgi:hypothetical protein